MMSTNRLSIRYFAWVRERVGVAEEQVEVPAGVSSVAGLIEWLSGRDEGYAAAFAEPGIIRAALDRDHVEHDAPLGTAREVAFFPPMTGG
jgi:molybdopterin synthase sulfur carrier subunit